MILRAGDEPIPGYHLEEFLGKGQFGQVWKARSPGKAFCALKFLDLSGKQGRKEFRAIQRVKEIRHAHLMPITALWMLDEEGTVLNDAAMEGMGRDSTLVDKTLVIPNEDEPAKPALLVVAQLLGDKTLGDRLEECTLEGHEGIPVEELLTYMEETAKGVDYLNSAKHDLGSGIFAIQHCDIKPANILLAGDSVLICDYGVAQALADSGKQSRATSMVGSPAYMAPECIEQQPSSASDQYSLAVSYYELRTGALPFSKTTFADVIDSHRQGKLDLSLVSPAEKKVIQKATSVDPNKRYGSTVEMVQHLRRAALGEPIPAKKWRYPLLTAAAVLLSGCLLGGYLAHIYGWGAPNARTIQVVMDPVSGQLTIDGEPQVLAADGTVTIKCDADAQLEIVATGGPEYRDQRETISVASLTEETLNVNLKRDPQFFADQSEHLLSTGDFDGAVVAWEGALSHDDAGVYRVVPSPLVQRQGPKGGLFTAAMSPDRRWTGTVGNDGVLRLQRANGLSTGEPVAPLESLADSKPHALAMSDDWAVVSYQDGTVTAVDLSVNPPVKKHIFNVQEDSSEEEIHAELIELAISPDQRWLVTTSSDADSLGKTLIHRFDLTTSMPRESKTLIGRHEDVVSDVAVDAQSTEVTTASWDRTVRNWSLTSPRAVANGTSIVGRHNGDVYCLERGATLLAFGGEGTLVASSAGESEDHRVTLRRQENVALPMGHSAPIDLVSLSPSEDWLVSSSEESELYVWDTTASLDSPIVLRNGHTGRVNSVCFSGDERWLISGGEDGQVLLWDFANPESPKPLRVREPSSDSIVLVAVVERGRKVVAYTKSEIYVWDLPRCTVLKRACDNAGKNPMPVKPKLSVIEA